MTKEERESARAILAKMTPGEWLHSDSHGLCVISGGILICDMEDEQCLTEDARGIAYLRNSFAAALDALDRRDAMIRRLIDAIQVAESPLPIQRIAVADAIADAERLIG